MCKYVCVCPPGFRIEVLNNINDANATSSTNARTTVMVLCTQGVCVCVCYGKHRRTTNIYTHTHNHPPRGPQTGCDFIFGTVKRRHICHWRARLWLQPSACWIAMRHNANGVATHHAAKWKCVCVCGGGGEEERICGWCDVYIFGV